jgi:hypothetical protein
MRLPMIRRSKRFALSLPLAAFHGASFVDVLGVSIAAADAHQSLPAWFTAITIAFAFPVVPPIAALLSVFWPTPSGDLLALVGGEVAVALAWAYVVVCVVCRVLPSKAAPPTRPAEPLEKPDRLSVPEILTARIPEILAGLRKETGNEDREVRAV